MQNFCQNVRHKYSWFRLEVINCSSYRMWQMSFRELDVILRTGYTTSYWSKNDTAGFERLDISCVFKLHSHLKISFFMMSSYNYFIYSLFQAFKIRPRTPSDPRKAYITLLQEIPEIAHIFSIGVTKQSECDLDQFLIFKVRKKLLCLITVGKPILLFILVTCFGCNTMSVTDLDEYHLQIPLGMKSIDDFLLEYEANSYFQDYHCVM